MPRRAIQLLVLVAVLPCTLAGQASESTTYANRATADLVALARSRHVHQDSLVRDYRAVIQTRLDASAGRSRFARLVPLFAHETAARVTWHQPNDLKLEVLGIRAKSAFPDTDLDMAYDRPWFVPRSLGDSIRLMGLPETAALHPLAPGAERFYRYAISDSVILDLPGRMVRAIGIRVEPKILAPSMVAGEMWVDAESADVVRMTVTFLGEYLWDIPDADATAEDSADTRNGNKWAQRFLTVQADLEYSLLENRYWMPYRQLLALTVEINFLIQGALPVRAVTTFRDYEVNVDSELAFAVPVDSLEEKDRERIRCDTRLTFSDDTAPRCANDLSRDERRRQYGYVRSGLWAGGRWEVDIPPRDSLTRFGWRDSMDVQMDEIDAERIRRVVADLETMAEDLPPEWIGRRRFGLAWEQLADVVRFNRVQGPSLGLGYAVRPGPAFTTLRGTGRFGISDRRVTASLAWRREAPSAAFEARTYYAVAEVEPWTNGQSLGNSLNALFAGHDDADYYLHGGGGISLDPYTGPLRDVRFRLAFEAHRSMSTRAGSAVNDALGGSGVFPANPAVLQGAFFRTRIEPTWWVGRARIAGGVEGLAGTAATGGRGWLTARIPFSILGRTGALSLKTGHVVGDSIPQLRMRVGGPATVRGYDYGTLRGEGMWSAQLDVAFSKRWYATPVLFVDAGDTFAVGERFDAGDALVSVGVGASLLNGWMRFNLAKPLNPSRPLRFDLLFSAPR